MLESIRFAPATLVAVAPGFHSFGMAADAAPTAAADSATRSTAQESKTEAESALAAVFSDRLSGHRTAAGERYDPKALTAAHKTCRWAAASK